MTHRVICDLNNCSPLGGWPSFIPKPRGLKGSKAAGRAYEKRIGRRLRRKWPDLVSGQWFEYSDANGIGCCQTDHYVVLPSQVLLFECKLTETDTAFSQIDYLYRPVLERLFKRPVTGVQVCKHLCSRNPRLILDVELALAHPGANFVWHCLS